MVLVLHMRQLHMVRIHRASRHKSTEYLFMIWCSFLRISGRYRHGLLSINIQQQSHVGRPYTILLAVAGLKMISMTVGAHPRHHPY